MPLSFQTKAFAYEDTWKNYFQRLILAKRRLGCFTFTYHSKHTSPMLSDIKHTFYTFRH